MWDGLARCFLRKTQKNGDRAEQIIPGKKTASVKIVKDSTIGFLYAHFTVDWLVGCVHNKFVIK